MKRPERFCFTTDFWENQVVLNGRLTVQTNELLTECLQASFDEAALTGTLFEASVALNELLPGYHEAQVIERYEPEEHLSQEMILNFDTNVRRFLRAIEEVDQYELSLPPYNRIYEGEEPQLCDRVFQVLDSYPLLWKVPDEAHPSFHEMAKLRPYTPFVLIHPRSYPDSFFSHEERQSRTQDKVYSVPIRDFYQLTCELDAIFRERTHFLYHYMDSVDIFRNLLDKYLNRSGHFQTERERSQAIARYEQENPDLKLKLLRAENVELSSGIFNQEGEPRFSERYLFQDAISFFYVDFLRGLQSNFIPKRCSNCGRWFLQTGGKYFEYCARPLEDDASKTCRDVGAQESYAQKCRNDPVWKTYLRAYKTHFARRKKGKMTPDEFRIWADNAILWRGQAERGELDFDTYYAMIRK